MEAQSKLLDGTKKGQRAGICKHWINDSNRNVSPFSIIDVNVDLPKSTQNSITAFFEDKHRFKIVMGGTKQSAGVLTLLGAVILIVNICTLDDWEDWHVLVMSLFAPIPTLGKIAPHIRKSSLKALLITDAVCDVAVATALMNYMEKPSRKVLNA